jgi:hypothetical protein
MPASIDLPVSGADDGLYFLPRSREVRPEDGIPDDVPDDDADAADTDADAADQDAIDLGPPLPSLPPAPPPPPSWVPFSPKGDDRLALVRSVGGAVEIHMAFRGLNTPTYTSASAIRQIDEDAVASCRQMRECQRYAQAAANHDRLARAARAAQANLAHAEAALGVLMTDDVCDDLPQRKILVEQRIAKLRAEVASANELEKSAASIERARRQAALDAMDREHNLTAAKASRDAAARVNELAKVIAEKVGPELLEMAAAMATWDGLGVLVSVLRRPSRDGLLARLKAEAIGAPYARPPAEEPKVKPAAATATTPA